MVVTLGRTGLGAALAAGLLCGAVAPSQGAENGVGIYVLGTRGPLSGILPPPGLYFQNDVYYYRGNASPSRELPFNGKLLAGVGATMWVDAPTLMWSTPVEVLGGNLAFSATLPIGGPSIDAALALSAPPVNAVIGRGLHDSIGTFGDPLLTSYVGWHAGNLHWNAGVTVNVPIGDYQEGAIANLAFNRWASDLFAAATYFDQSTGFEVSGSVGITFNGTNSVTDYTTGTELHAEYAAVYHATKQFDFGALGYVYDQITGDSGTGAKLGDFKGRAAAIGGTLGYNFLLGQTPVSTRLKVYREFAVTNRLEGTTGFLTVAFPLSVSAPPPSSGTVAARK